MKRLILMLSVLFSTLFISCDSKTYEEIATVTDPTYSDNIKPLFQSKCTICHSSNTTRAQEPFLTTSLEIQSAIGSNNLACLINDPTQCFYESNNIMPPTGRLPQVNIDMINLWISNGFPN